MSPTSRNILHFICRSLLMALAVIAPFLVWYVYADPFKILYHYENYYDDPQIYPARIGLNKGMVTINAYIDNLRRGIRNNAFIFGSSISCYYDADEWCRLLCQDSTSSQIKPIHFDSSSESLMSMARKIEYLNSRGASIDYALLVLDPIIMNNDDNDSPFAIDPPELKPGVIHRLKYHYTFFRASTNANFIKNLLAAHFTGRGDNIGHSPIFEYQPIVHNMLTNQETIPMWDSIITNDPKAFYSKYPLVSPATSVTSGPSIINGAKRAALQKIAQIFSQQCSDYQIIISPNRRGVSLSPTDLKELQTIFEPSRVHDFSEIYAPYLQNDTLLYDNTHYRPPFASKLMNEIYSH